MVNNILVIGNGYDLAHGLRTSYNDFIEWVRCKNDDYSCLVDYADDIFCERLKKNGFITYFLNYTKEVCGWVDLEKLIKEITDYFELFIKNYSDFIDSRYSISLDTTKADFFRDGKIRMINCLYAFPLFDQNNTRGFYYSMHLDKRYYTAEFGLNKTEIMKLLKNQLDDVIRLLKIYLELVMGEEKNIRKISQITSINPSYVISFNYTETYKLYGIRPENVFHVHGSLHKDNLVLGFNDDDPDNLDFIYFKKYFQRIQKLTGYINNDKFKSKKEKREITNPSSGKLEQVEIEVNPIVHFYGHSVDKTDGDIIQKLRSLANGFVIYKYNQEDYEQKVINLIDVFGKEQATQMIQTGWIKFVSCES